jgi:hypothetical protein
MAEDNQHVTADTVPTLFGKIPQARSRIIRIA